MLNLTVKHFINNGVVESAIKDLKGPTRQWKIFQELMGKDGQLYDLAMHKVNRRSSTENAIEPFKRNNSNYMMPCLID